MESLHAGVREPFQEQDEGARTESAPEKPMDARRLRAVFLDLLGRPPFVSERTAWKARRVDELLTQVIGSEEFWANWLEDQLYFFLLVDNFRPGSGRVSAIPAAMCDGEIGLREALHRIVISASFDRRNPGPDTFVTVVMEQLLGTTVQKRPRELEIGKRVYDGAKGNFLGHHASSQADIVRIAIDDRQALRHFLEREYARLVRAEPSARDVSRWVRLLERDDLGFGAIVLEWFESDAYERRLETLAPLSNRAYVRALFVDLVDELPPPGEARRLGNAFDGLADAGPLRSVVARLLLDSGRVPLLERDEVEDPTAWVAELFERLLGRAASEQELEAFVAAFHDPACRPATVVYAIVSHPEYQTW